MLGFWDPSAPYPPGSLYYADRQSPFASVPLDIADITAAVH